MYSRARYFMFIRYAAFHLQQLSAKRQRDNAAQKSIEAKDTDTKEASNETETKDVKRDNKSQEKEVKDKKQKKEEKKEKESAKKEAAKEAKETKEAEDDKAVKGDKNDDELLLNENYSEIDTDVAKKIVESITDSICSGGDKQESDCKYIHFSINLTVTGLSCFVSFFFFISPRRQLWTVNFVIRWTLKTHIQQLRTLVWITPSKSTIAISSI